MTENDQGFRLGLTWRSRGWRQGALFSAFLLFALLFVLLFQIPLLHGEDEVRGQQETAADVPAAKGLKAEIARELVAFAPQFKHDTRLDALSKHLSTRARAELTSFSREAVDAWLHREVYGLLFHTADSNTTPDGDMTRSEKMLSRAADHLALSFSETGQKLVGRVQDSAFEGTPGHAFDGLETELQEDVIAALIDSGEAAARASGMAALANLELKYELEGGDLSRWSVLAVQPLYSSPDKTHNTFAQLSWFHGDSRDAPNDEIRDTFNIGAGYRYMTPDERHILGANMFYDHEMPYHHQRMSLGVEYLNSLIGLRANRYFRLSGYKDRDDGFQERALGGWDVELSGRPPQIPQLELFLRGFQWEREATEFVNPTGEDITGHEVRAEYTPFPALTLEAGLRNETDQDDLEALLAARFNYRLGADPAPQLRPTQSFTLQSIADRRFEKVRRENLIRKQIRANPDLIAEVTSIIGSLTVTPDGETPFAASVGDRLQFGSTLEVSNTPGDLAELLFGDGGFLRIGEGTEVAFRSGELELLSSGFLQFTSGSTNVTLLSAGDSVSLLGTDVELRRNAGRTTLRVRDGSALITNSNGTQAVEVQEMGLADNGAKPVLVGRGDTSFDAHVADTVTGLNLVNSSIASTNLAPYVPSAVAITGIQQVGQTLDFTVQTTQVVNVTGTPELVIDVGGTERRATYQSGSGSSSLLFQYTIQAGDSGATSIDADYIDYVAGSDITSAQNRRLVPDVTGSEAVNFNNAPAFDESDPVDLPVPPDSTDNEIDNILSVTDADSGDTLEWTIVSGPTNGTLDGFPATVPSSGSSITPTGLTYTPNPGFSGSDTFDIQISDGFESDTITVDINVIEPLIERGTVSGSGLGEANGLDVVGNLAYVAARDDDALTIVDVSNPAAPAIVGSVSDGNLNGAENVVVSGNYAYVASFIADALTIVDVSNPAAPAVVGSVSDGNLDGARDVTVVGNYAYVAARFANRLNVVDVSNPTSPSIVGSIFSANLDGASAVKVVGGLAYVANFVGDSLTVIDVSDPVNPTEVGSIGSVNLDASFGVQVTGGFAYVAARSADALTILDISNPTSPFEVSSTTSLNLNGAWGLDVEGRYAYVGSQNSGSLTVLDVVDPTSPVEIGSVSSGNLSGAKNVVVNGNFAYVVAFSAGALTIVETNLP